MANKWDEPKKDDVNRILAAKEEVRKQIRSVPILTKRQAEAFGLKIYYDPYLQKEVEITSPAQPSVGDPPPALLNNQYPDQQSPE